MIPLGTHGIYAEGNMENLSPTIPINISHILHKIENFYIGVNCLPNEIKIYTSLFKEFRDLFDWSYDKNLGIDPHILKHGIKIYLNAKPI